MRTSKSCTPPGKAGRPKTSRIRSPIPLTVSLLGIPGVKAIRSNSFFGFSTIYVIFSGGRGVLLVPLEDTGEAQFFASGTLPEGVQPTLGPDATALGQVFWYTLEGEGFGLDELRTIQDYYVRYYSAVSRGGQRSRFGRRVCQGISDRYQTRTQ